MAQCVTLLLLLLRREEERQREREEEEGAVALEVLLFTPLLLLLVKVDRRGRATNGVPLSALAATPGIALCYLVVRVRCGLLLFVLLLGSVRRVEIEGGKGLEGVGERGEGQRSKPFAL